MLSLAFALLSSAQDPLSEPALGVLTTQRCFAAPLTKIVADLAKVAPIKLSANPSLAKQVVLVDTHDKSWREVLAKLALVTDNEWVRVGDTLTLTPSDTLRKQAELEAKNALKAELQSAIEDYKDIADASYKPNEIAEAIIAKARRDTVRRDILDSIGPRGQQDAYAPTGRILARALSKLDLNVVADLEYDERVVFSTRPTKMQRPLDLKSLTTTTQADNLAYEEAIKTVRKIWPDIEEQTRLEFQPLQSIDRINLVIFKAEQNFGFESIVASLTVFGKDQSASSSCILWTDKNVGRLMSRLGADWAEPTFACRPESLRHARAIAAIGSESPETGDNKPVFDLIKNPDLTDPLSLLPSDYLIAYAQHKQSDLIAEVPDLAIAVLLMMDETDAWASLENQFMPCLFDPVEADGWLLLRQKDRFWSRSNRVDRTALAQYIKSPNAQSLDASGIYSARRGSDHQFNVVELATLMLTAPTEGFIGMPTFYNIEGCFLSFWGTVDTTQKNKLFGGSPIAYSALSEQQKAMFRRIAFGTRGLATLDFSNAIDPPQPGEEFGQPQEMTDLLPNGLQEDARVTVSQKQSRCLYIPADEKGWQLLDMSTLGYMMAAKVDPKVWEQVAKDPLPARIRLGQDRRCVVKFWVNKNHYLGFEYADASIDPSGREYKIDQLPPDVQRQIKVSMDKALKSGGDGGRL